MISTIIFQQLIISISLFPYNYHSILNSPKTPSSSPFSILLLPLQINCQYQILSSIHLQPFTTFSYPQTFKILSRQYFSFLPYFSSSQIEKLPKNLFRQIFAAQCLLLKLAHPDQSKSACFIGIIICINKINFMINIQSKQKPKTVKINLPQAVRQKSQKSSPEKSPNKFKQPISKLRKTFGSNHNVFEKINQNKRQRQNQIHSQRKRRKLLQEQVEQDLSDDKALNQRQLQISKVLFESMDTKGKQFVQAKDLENIKDEELRNTLQVVFYRKQRNSLFDFIYNCWDTGAMQKIGKMMEIERSEGDGKQRR